MYVILSPSTTTNNTKQNEYSNIYYINKKMRCRIHKIGERKNIHTFRGIGNRKIHTHARSIYIYIQCRGKKLLRK